MPSLVSSTRAGGRRLRGQRAVGGLVGRAGLLLAGVVEGADPVEHRSSRAHLGVDVGLVDRARPHRLGQRRRRRPGRARHLEVEPGRRRDLGGGHAEPVGDDEPLEAPLVAEDVVEEPVVLGAPDAVEPVVAGHDAEGAALAHRQLERQRGRSPAACARRRRS